jgi:integrase
MLGLEWDRVDFERGSLDLSWQLQRLAWEHGCGGSCTRIRGTDCPRRTLNAPADWEHRNITGGLWWSRPKSSAGWRVIPLVSPFLEILEMRRGASVLEPNPHGLVWTQSNGRPIDPSRDSEAWHAVLKLAGVPDARLHDARHTTASLLGRAGVPIQTVTEILGHGSKAQSRDYMTVDMAQKMDALTRMSALMAPTR